MQVAVSALSSNFGLNGFAVLEIEQFSYFGILAWNCLFTPIFRGFWGIFSPNDVIYRCDPQKALPCAETRRLSHKATWAQDREKKDRTLQDSQKSHKGVIFHLFGRSPHWTDFHKNLHSSCRPRRNHVCKVMSWNFQGLRFYSRSNFPFFVLILSWA